MHAALQDMLQGYWGLMSGINGIFDLVKFIDVWVGNLEDSRSLLRHLAKVINQRTRQAHKSTSSKNHVKAVRRRQERQGGVVRKSPATRGR